jgi:malonyl-CoA decarboxylase
MWYEAVHPILGWADLKSRLAANRRVFGYFHSSLPEEPLVLLHTALMGSVPGSMEQILAQDAQGIPESRKCPHP